MQALSEYLASRDHEVTVWTTDALDVEHLWAKGKSRVDTPEETYNGVHIRRFPVRHFPFHRYAMRLLGEVRVGKWRYIYAPGSPRVPDLIQEAEETNDRFDLVHVSPFPYDSLLYAAKVLAEKQAIPVVCTPFLHLGEGPNSPVRVHYSRDHQIEFLLDCDAVLFQTTREMEFLKDRGLPIQKLHKGGIGIDPKALAGGDGQRFRRKYGITDPIIAFIGVRCFDKGVIHLIKACESLWEKGERFRLVLLGGSVREFDNEFANLPEKTRKCCLLIDDADEICKRDLLDAMSALALPSRTDSFGIVILEAWSYGKPVVVADAGGPGEVVRDGVDGVHVTFGDITALSAGVKSLLSDKDKANRLGKNGLDRLGREFLWSNILSNIEYLYERMVHRDTP